MIDKNGQKIELGMHLIPYNGEGVEVIAMIERDTEDFGHVLLVNQVEDPMAFSPLTQEQLSDLWIIKED